MNQNSLCKLCGKSAKLIKKSHIIPNFMYQGLFDDSNRMILMPLSNPEARSKYYQTGFFDKYILCKKCDNELLSKLEKYSSTILYGGISKNPPIIERKIGPDGMKSVGVANLDYTQFKLFLLSILWRSHVSTNRFFSKVDIPNDEPLLRHMLLNNDAGIESDYQIAIIGIEDKSENLVRIMPDPNIKKIGNGYFATFFISGFVYFINLNPKSDLYIFNAFSLKELGEIEIPILSGELANRTLKAFGIPDEIADYFSK